MNSVIKKTNISKTTKKRKSTLFYRAYIYGQSRVIAGAHWQSDVDAIRVGSSIGFCALQGSEAFREQMKKAQTEYAEKISQGTGVRKAVIVEHPASARAYGVDGVSANEATRGVLISNGQKFVKK